MVSKKMASLQVLVTLLCVVLINAKAGADFTTVTHSITSTLELVHVIFRHGDRTPDGTYPTDPHANETYFPTGLGQLTNEGRTTTYNVGIALRKTYGNFIGKLFTPKVIEANTSPVDRCQASLQAVLAGLFPPRNENVWNPNLTWQPIPYKMLPQTEDKIFLSMVNCPNFFRNFFAYQATGAVAENFREFDDVMQYIHEHSGVPNDPFSINSALFGTLKGQEDWGLTLPCWTRKIWPQPLSTISAKLTKELFVPEGNRAIGAGFLMSKIINDTHLTIDGVKSVEGRKLYLYSGHESNIVGILAWLGILEEHNPEYGAYIVVEVHNFLGRRFIKIMHENFEALSPVPVFIPRCGYYCPIEVFEELYEDEFNPYDLCG